MFLYRMTAVLAEIGHYPQKHIGDAQKRQDQNCIQFQIIQLTSLSVILLTFWLNGRLDAQESSEAVVIESTLQYTMLVGRRPR